VARVNRARIRQGNEARQRNIRRSSKNVGGSETNKQAALQVGEDPLEPTKFRPENQPLSSCKLLQEIHEGKG
jgi:hypothetical protein